MAHTSGCGLAPQGNWLCPLMPLVGQVLHGHASAAVGRCPLREQKRAPPSGEASTAPLIALSRPPAVRAVPRGIARKAIFRRYSTWCPSVHCRHRGSRAELVEDAQAVGAAVRKVSRTGVLVALPGCRFVEVLAAYSHSTELADLRRRLDARPASAIPTAPLASKPPWSLRDRLDKRTRADLIAAYRSGETAASLAAAHGLSLRSCQALGGRRGSPP